MSDSPTHPPSSAAPPPNPVPDCASGAPATPPRWRARKWGLGEKVAWVAIVLAVVLVLVQPLIFPPGPAAERERAPGFPLLLQGRYVVGVNSALPLKASGKSGALLNTLRRTAKSPADELCVVMVEGELEGTDATELAAAKLAAQHPEFAGDVATLQEIYGGGAEASRWRDFRNKYGWFADLAASAGKPDTDLLRAATLRAAVRTVVVAGLGFVIALGLAAIGLVLLIVAAVLYFTQRLRPDFGRGTALPVSCAAYVQGFAFYLGIMASGGLILRAILRLIPGKPAAGLWGTLVLPLAFLAGAVWPMVRGQSWQEWRAATGLHAGRGILREMIAGAAGYVAGLPIVGVGVLLTAVLMKISGLDATHPIVKELMGSPARIVLIFVLACVYAPITEELMFRGALFAHLRERLGFWVSALLVALIFAIIHPQGWPALPMLGSLALVFAGVREWRGSIVGCMAGHAINNGVALTAVLLMVS